MAKKIVLENGLEFVIITDLVLDNQKYLFLSTNEEDMKFIFARVEKDNTITPIEDGETIVKLHDMVDEKVLKAFKELNIN